MAGNSQAGIVLFDIYQRGTRWASKADMVLEARLLGLDPSDTIMSLVRELERRGLASYSEGRLVKKARA